MTTTEVKEKYGLTWNNTLGCYMYLDNEILDKMLEDYADSKVVISEYQLCPKCFGDGHLGRYNPHQYMSTNSTPLCDVCHGKKILVKPIIKN